MKKLLILFAKWILNKYPTLKYEIAKEEIAGREVVTLQCEGKEVHIPDNVFLINTRIENSIVYTNKLNCYHSGWITGNAFYRWEMNNNNDKTI